MRVVIDTIVIISAIGKYSPNRKLFDAILNGSLEICISNDIFHEYIEILEIMTVKFPVFSLPSNDPWRIVPGHPFFITSSPPPPQTYLIGEQCPNSPWSAGDSVIANWSCWDTTSLDNTSYNLNPFLNVNYQVTHTPEFIALAKNEWYIYGSAGHGRFARAYPHVSDERQGYSSELFVSELMEEKRYLKQKQYELKDHLGNVRVVLSDMKIPVNANDTLPPFRADVLAAYSHYPFGMLQPGMYSETGTTYRFGFNGMLRDDEVKDIGSTLPQEEGVGNSYATEFRMYDPQVGRWFSIDPEKQQFPWSSPYVGMGNNPVSMVDPNGDYYWNANHNTKLVKSMSTNISINNVASTKSDAELNNIADIWQNKKSGHYAPKVAEYVKNKNNSIPVIQGNVTISHADGFVDPNIKGNPIGINTNSKDFNSSLFHETIHNMGYLKEFDAYSAQLAAGYGGDNLFKIISYQDNWMNGEAQNKKANNLRDELSLKLFQSFPDNSIRDNYFNEFGTVKNPTELIKYMKEYGEIIIGASND